MNPGEKPLTKLTVKYGLLLNRSINNNYSAKGKLKPYIGICLSDAPICDLPASGKRPGSYKVDVVNANTLRIERWDMRRCAIVTDPESKVYQQLTKFKDSETFKIIAQGRENRNLSDLKLNVS